MRIEIVAVGTELLLGQIADTNSKWMGEHLAAIGVASHFHQAVGDNHERIVLAFRTALARSDGVIVCGGLGPTHDDITRDAIAEVMNVALYRDEQVVENIRTMFNARGRQMPDSNLRQADVPAGATIIPQTKGTAPGLICPVGHKVVYAVPGVPYEMADMFERAIAPDLVRRMAERGETTGVIASRVIRTWGMSESALAETLADHIDGLDGTPTGAAAGAAPPPATIAFLASGIEGIKVRVTVRADDESVAASRLDAEETEIRRILTEAAGDVVFGIDDEAIEHAVAQVLAADGLTLGLAESLTGGLAAVAAGQRARGQSVVPGLGGVLCVGGQVRRARGARGTGGHRGGGPGHGRRRPIRARGRRGPVHDRGGRARPPGRPTPGHRVRGAGACGP